MHATKHIALAQSRPVTSAVGLARIVDEHGARVVSNKDISVVFLGDHDIIKIDRGVVVLLYDFGNGHGGNGTEQNGGIDRGVLGAERKPIGIGARLRDVGTDGQKVAFTVERGSG